MVKIQAEKMGAIARLALACWLGMLLFAGTAHAALVIESATPTNITVEPGATIAASVTTERTGGDWWRGTSWRLGSTGFFTCVDTPDHNPGNNPATEGFEILAPTTAGTYDLYFRSHSLYTNLIIFDLCWGEESNTFTIVGSVIVPSPYVVSINRAAANPSTAATVTWTVIFNRLVTGVNLGDFALAVSGLSGTPAITGISGSGMTYTVTASTGAGSGSLGLNLVDNDSIIDNFGNQLGRSDNDNGSFTGEVYDINRNVSVTPGAFNAFEPVTATGQTSGVIKTKVAGTSFELDIVALNTARTAIQTGFVGDVKVELLGNAAIGTPLALPANCPQTATVLSTQTVSFVASDAGRKRNVAFAAIGNVWRDVRVRISYPATGTASVIACSADNFAIRPAALQIISATDATWSSAGTNRPLNNTAVTDGTVHKAGQPFTLTASSLNASGNITSNYSGSPVAAVSNCLNSGIVTGCTTAFGTLTTGTWAAGPGAGSVIATSASYSDVGAFGLQLRDTTFSDVDLADSSEVERFVPLSAKANVGRFVPDHFDVTPVLGNVPAFRTFNDATCAARSFTYIGQAFGYAAAPAALITARNAAGDATRNYQGAWWKIAAADVVQVYSPAAAILDNSAIGTPTVTPRNDNSGQGTVELNVTDTLKYVRNSTAPQAPFEANIGLTISVQDWSETSGTIVTNAFALFNGGGAGIEFDAGKTFRFGRLMLANAHGSELLRLPVPMEAQFWNGTGFVTNSADNCTSLLPANFSLGNYKKNLAACETAVSISGRLVAGRSNLALTKPGAGNNGSVEVSLNLGSTAAGNTCLPPNTASPASAASLEYLQIKSGTTFTADPTARATFGLRKSGPLIYLREMY